MKILLIILVMLVAGFFILFFGLGYMSRSGTAPGLVQGKLSLCPDKPNCVCSEKGNNTIHTVEPIDIPEGSDRAIFALLSRIIQETGGTTQTAAGDYLAATFTSNIFGFVDDLEFRIDRQQGLIHIRSASRVGYSDAGVNRKRAQQITQLFKTYSTKSQ